MVCFDLGLVAADFAGFGLDSGLDFDSDSDSDWVLTPQRRIFDR